MEELAPCSDLEDTTQHRANASSFYLEHWTLPSDVAYQLWMYRELYRTCTRVKNAKERWQAAAKQGQKQLAYEEYLEGNREMHRLAQRIHYGRHVHVKED